MRILLVYISLIAINARKCTVSSSSEECIKEKPCVQKKQFSLIFTRPNRKCVQRESSSSSSCEENDKHNRDIICFDSQRSDQNIRGNMNEYLFIIQGVLSQGVAGTTKLIQGFANEIIRHLTSGVRNIIKAAESQASEELNRIEQRIVVIIRKYSDEILNEVDELVTTTNNDLLDNLVKLIKDANNTIKTELTKLAPQPIPPAPEVTSVDLIASVAIVNTTFADLVGNILLLFKKATSYEKGLLNKILIERKNGLIKEVTQVLNDFRIFLNSLFADIQSNESKLINNTFDHSSRKLLIELDNILSQIGQSIISIVKGCNTNFRPPLTVNSGALCAPFTGNNFF
ncbi:hypothetical protein NGRA_0842 [Nosema granulosis]|uniref:Uncharacterized protein n=1 Tax=Nosema granulosis TaxID=83296 RepID=A0A9P6H057_9MICR|nr:hypothetical protein NGRA_0842 [Nosema granulosis]